MERDRLKRRTAELEQRIRLLEGTTALVLARRLHAYREPVLKLLKAGMAVNRVRRRLMGATEAELAAPDTMIDIDLPTRGLDRSKETVLLISHAATQTGAPILAWNIAAALSATFNVVTVIIHGGPLAKAFKQVSAEVVGPLGFDAHEPRVARRIAWNLARTYKPVFAIANTTESRYLAAPLAQESVPVVTLVHEFAAGLFPKGSMQEAFDWSAEIVFPATVVRESFLPGYQSLFFKTPRILPQGQSVVPEASSIQCNADKDALKGHSLRRKLRPEGCEDAMLVAGMGPADFRKGADLFIATAHMVKRLAPGANIRWAWIGSAHDPLFLDYIGEQICRSGLQNDLVLVDTIDDIETVYDEADLLFVSSRFDPLPNVGIDMALKGKPVLCFDQATGLAEILKSMPETEDMAVPYLDAAVAAEVLIGLEADRERLARTGQALREKAKATFDMKRYVAELVALGRDASKQVPRGEMRSLLLQPGHFDASLYRGKQIEIQGQIEDSINHYINYSSQAGVKRRAMLGFHPGIYAEKMPEVHAAGWSDPLIHFLRAGKPEGPWLHPVIRLDPKARPQAAAGTVALHGHFHYTDNIGDFLVALEANRSRCDIFLTTSTEAKRDELRRAMKPYRRGKVDIEIVPNLGRDIGPFVHVLRDNIQGRYEIVGHVHGKRSVHAHTLGPNVGELWRNFLWQHLMGPLAPAVDTILRAFEGDAKLGLVFPEDPQIRDWDDNYDDARALAARMEFREPLPKNFDFPMGTMFWARTEAMMPLLRLNFTWTDYPPEPLPLDGSILHALERLIPSVAHEAGYTYATTHLPQVGGR